METVSVIAKYRSERDGMSLEEFGALFNPALNKSTILRWERNGVPVERVPLVEAVTGISRHLLRPDFFGQAAEVIAAREAAE